MYREKPCLDVPLQSQSSYLTAELNWAEQSKLSTESVRSQYQPMEHKSSDLEELDSCYLPESFFSNFLNTPKSDYDLSLSFQRSGALANSNQANSGLKLHISEAQGRNSEMSSMKLKQGDINFSVQHQPNRVGVAVSAIDEKQSFLNFLDNLKVTERRLNGTGSSRGFDENYSVGSPWSTGSMTDAMSGGFTGHTYHQKVQESFWHNTKSSEASFMNATLGSPSIGALESHLYDRSFQSSGNSGQMQSPSNYGAQTNFGADRFDHPSATSKYFYENVQLASSLSQSVGNQVVHEPPKHQQQQIPQTSSNSVFGDAFLTRPTSLVWSPRSEEVVGTAAEYALQNLVPQNCISNMPSGNPTTAIGQVNSNTRQVVARPAKRLKPFAVNRKSEYMKTGASKEDKNCLNEFQRVKANDGNGSWMSENAKHVTEVRDQEQISAHMGHGFSMFSDNMAANLPFSGASNSGASVCTTSSTGSFCTPGIPRILDSSSVANQISGQPNMDSTRRYDPENINCRPSCDVSCPNFFMKVENCTRCKQEKPPDGSKTQTEPAPELLTMLSVGSSGSVKSESEQVGSPVSIADLIATPGVSIVENYTPITRGQTRRISHNKSYFTNTENKEAERKNSLGPLFPKTRIPDRKIEEKGKSANPIEEAKAAVLEQSSRNQSSESTSTGSNASWIFAVPEQSSQITEAMVSPINAMSVTDLESGSLVAKGTEHAEESAEPQVAAEDDQSQECRNTDQKTRKRYDRDQLMNIGLSAITKREPDVADENRDWFSLVFIGNNSESEGNKKNITAYEICSRPFSSAVFNAKKVCLHPAFQKALLQSVSDK